MSIVKRCVWLGTVIVIVLGVAWWHSLTVQLRFQRSSAYRGDANYKVREIVLALRASDVIENTVNVKSVSNWRVELLPFLGERQLYVSLKEFGPDIGTPRPYCFFDRYKSETGLTSLFVVPLSADQMREVVGVTESEWSSVNHQYILVVDSAALGERWNSGTGILTSLDLQTVGENSFCADLSGHEWVIKGGKFLMLR